METRMQLAYLADSAQFAAAFGVQLFKVAILLLLSCLGVSAQATVLELGVEDAAAPWSKKDGTGFANDVVKAAYRAVGIEAKFRVLPYARCKYLAKKGDIPACFSVSPEPHLEDDILLSRHPLFRLHYDYYHFLGAPLHASGTEDLPPGTTVGIVNGYEYPPSVARVQEHGVKLEPSHDEVTNLRKLALGRIDAAILNYNDIKTIRSMTDAAGVTGKVGFVFHAGEMNAYVGFSKNNSLGRWAKREFDRGHELIHKNGTLAKIENLWHRRINAK